MKKERSFSAERKKENRIIAILNWGCIALNIMSMVFCFLRPPSIYDVCFALVCGIGLGMNAAQRWNAKNLKFYQEMAWDSLEQNMSVLKLNEDLLKELKGRGEEWRRE